MNVDSYYVLSGLLQEIGSFLADCLPCFVSCVATLLIYKKGEKNMTLFGDMRYNYISEMNNEAISLMRSGLSDEEILAKLREQQGRLHRQDMFKFQALMMGPESELGMMSTVLPNYI